MAIGRSAANAPWFQALVASSQDGHAHAAHADLSKKVAYGGKGKERV
ncbi:hypothetical protein [Paraburkholderia fungorum]|nr:hypothetical protein [Paraburkholderia fungorum]